MMMFYNTITYLPIEDMTTQQIKEELNYLREQVKKKDTLFGYDLQELLAVKKVLEDNQITPKILSSNLEMYKKGWEDCQKATQESWDSFNKSLMKMDKKG